ncbi:hypothetical protein H0H87_006647 [Tephrocybe sp. NHM501043]|nr:hypothetical protein H0H87_006647 [Tephrocybe sp. NHM501043]
MNTAQLGEKASYDTYLAAELAVDPPQSSTKRTQALTSSFAHAALERQLGTLKADKGELERKLKEKTLKVESLEQDRRWLADRETQERNEKEQEAAKWEEEKVIHFVLDHFSPWFDPYWIIDICQTCSLIGLSFVESYTFIRFQP